MENEENEALEDLNEYQAKVIQHLAGETAKAADTLETLGEKYGDPQASEEAKRMKYWLSIMFPGMENLGES